MLVSGRIPTVSESGHAVVIAVVAAADAVGHAANACVVDVLLLCSAANGDAVPLDQIKIIAACGLPRQCGLMACAGRQRDRLALGVRNGERGCAPLGPHAVLVLHAHANGIAAVGEVNRGAPCLFCAVDRSGGVAAGQRQLIGFLLGGLPGDARARAGGLDHDGRCGRGVDGDKLGLVAPFRRRAVCVVGADAPVFCSACEFVRRNVVILVFSRDGCKGIPRRAVGGPLQIRFTLRRAGGNDVLPREAVGDCRVDDDAGRGDGLGRRGNVCCRDLLPCGRRCRAAVCRHLYAPFERP